MGNINFKGFEYSHSKEPFNINAHFNVSPAGYVLERDENGNITKFNLTGFNIIRK